MPSQVLGFPPPAKSILMSKCLLAHSFHNIGFTHIKAELAYTPLLLRAGCSEFFQQFCHIRLNVFLGTCLIENSSCIPCTFIISIVRGNNLKAPEVIKYFKRKWDHRRELIRSNFNHVGERCIYEHSLWGRRISGKHLSQIMKMQQFWSTT